MEEPQNLQRVIFLVIPEVTTKDVFFFETLSDASYKESISIFDEVFKYMYICSAQSKYRYHSSMVLRKVRYFTWLHNSRMVSDYSRIAQGIVSVLPIR